MLQSVGNEGNKHQHQQSTSADLSVLGNSDGTFLSTDAEARLLTEDAYIHHTKFHV